MTLTPGIRRVICLALSNSSSRELAGGIEQIGNAIRQVERVTQQSAAAAQELSAQSQTLKEIVTRLTKMVGGEGREPAHQDDTHASRALEVVK